MGNSQSSLRSGDQHQRTGEDISTRNIKSEKINITPKKEDLIMVKFTVKDLEEKLGINHVVLRTWIRKYVEGEIYDKRNINYTELRKGILKKYSPEKVKELLGCTVEEIEVVIGEKVVNNYLDPKELVEGKNYIIRHYHMESTWRFEKVIDGENYLFSNWDQKFNCTVYKYLSITEIVNKGLKFFKD